MEYYEMCEITLTVVTRNIKRTTGVEKTNTVRENITFLK